MWRRSQINRRRAVPLVIGAGVLLALGFTLGVMLFTTLRPTPDPWQRFRATPTDIPYALLPISMDVTFDRPVGIAIFPGTADTAVLPTQGGQIWHVPLNGEDSPTLVGDITDRLIRDPGYEEGLTGLALSPDFAEDGRVYLAYAAGDPRRSVLSRFVVSDGRLDPESENIILEVSQPSNIHNIGQLAFGPDGYLYVGLGDGGSSGDELGHAQDLSTLLGSILRIDVTGETYEIPPDNPFVDIPGARPEIYAYGLRNPWRFAFDSETGDLWAGDVGELTWEEVNQILPGANYGWSIMEGHQCFAVAGCEHEGLVLPRAVYTRDDGCSITGGYVYRGSTMPELFGSYIYGDFCSGALWAVSTLDGSRPVRLAYTGVPIVSFGELPDGELLILGFSGEIFQLHHEVR